MTFLRRIEKFLRMTGMRPTHFGRRVAADPRLIFDMRGGRVPRTALIRKIEAFMAANAPEGQ